jgi:hypothetical protein
MEAFPHIDTIRAFCTDASQLFPQSNTLDFHNKADGHERRIATYVVENFRTVTSLEVRVDAELSRLKFTGLHSLDSTLASRSPHVRV